MLSVSRLAALCPAEQAALRFTLNPAARLIASDYPILRIWEVCRDGFEGDQVVDLDSGGDTLVLAQEPDFTITIERLPPGEYAFLAACANGATVAGALTAAVEVDTHFDLTQSLRTQIERGRIADFTFA